MLSLDRLRVTFECRVDLYTSIFMTPHLQWRNPLWPAVCVGVCYISLSLSSGRFLKWAGHASFYGQANLPAWWYIIFMDYWESLLYTSKSHTHVLWWHHICVRKSSIYCSYVSECIKLSITLIATWVGSILTEQKCHKKKQYPWCIVMIQIKKLQRLLVLTLLP